MEISIGGGSAATLPAVEPRMDPESRAWVDALGGREGDREAAAEHAELLAAVRDAVAEVLTPQQREVLLTVVAGRVPLDVLAERRGTTRGALYKTIHDARRKPRAHLAASGPLAGEEVSRR